MIATGLLAAVIGAGVPAAAPPPAVLARYALAAPGGGTVLRAVVRGGCPFARLDGRSLRLRLRAGPATLPLRPTISTAALSKPAAFPVSVCELTVPARTRQALVGGVRVPLVPAEPRRIVVIGDTGCRLKASEQAWQACNDPAAYPFARIARAAATFRPDLVIHVGDYLYRETPCPAQAGCLGSPWGYGWDSWQADLFGPAAPLFAAAPWAVIRGNHENCRRAGQGWYRLLDPRPLAAGQDCVDPGHDAAGDSSAPYVVPLGRSAQLVVLDLAAAGGKSALPAGSSARASAVAAWQALAAAGRSGRFTIAADHYPVLGLQDGEKTGDPPFQPQTVSLQEAFAGQGRLVPRGVDLLLAGHVHLWEQASFRGGYPSQFITGFSGTQEDVAPLPSTLPPRVSIAGIAAARVTAWTRGFGFMTLERTGRRQWRAIVRDVDGHPLRRCRIDGTASVCGPQRGSALG